MSYLGNQPTDKILDSNDIAPDAVTVDNIADPTLKALAGLDSAAGVVRQTGADTFTKDAVAFSFRNKLINGNFNYWQRGASQSTAGFKSADRWALLFTGGSATMVKQTHTIGETNVPTDYSHNYMRNIVVGGASAGDFTVVIQYIEDVRTLAGKTATVSFYAKADAARQMHVEMLQSFGTGGSPSAMVAINVGRVVLGTTWARYTLTVEVPSVVGKTLGTTTQSSLALQFWYSAGSNYASRTDSLGTQAGTFDICGVQVEEGDTATPFECRPDSIELALCQRYYFDSNNVSALGRAYDASNGRTVNVNFPVTMRTTPTITQLSSLIGGDLVVSVDTTAFNSNRVSITCKRPSSDLIYGGFYLYATAEFE